MLIGEVSKYDAEPNANANPNLNLDHNPNPTIADYPDRSSRSNTINFSKLTLRLPIWTYNYH